MNVFLHLQRWVRPGRVLVLLLSTFPALGDSVARAAPRVGAHDGYTRLVFDLPGRAKPDVTVAPRNVSVGVGLPLKAERGALKAVGVSAYAVAGSRVTVTFAPGYGHARASVLPAGGGLPNRLVIDVLTDAGHRVRVAAGGASAGTAAVRTASVSSVSGRGVPRPSAASVNRPASTSALQRPRVVLDPGHGGVDGGMQSSWVMEKDVTLDVALRARAELVRHGVEVVMTRATDRDLSSPRLPSLRLRKVQDLQARSQLARSGTVSAYISIHVNSGAAAAQGIETYYFGQPLPGRSRSLAVAENGGGSVGEELTRAAASSAQSLLGDILAQAKLSFSRDLARRVQGSLVSVTGAQNRGVLTDAFVVIKNPSTPAILVEVGFGSNATEGPKLATADYREQLAQGLARAILDFLHTQ